MLIRIIVINIGYSTLITGCWSNFIPIFCYLLFRRFLHQSFHWILIIRVNNIHALYLNLSLNVVSTINLFLHLQGLTRFIAWFIYGILYLLICNSTDISAIYLLSRTNTWHRISFQFSCPNWWRSIPPSLKCFIHTRILILNLAFSLCS